MTDAQLIAEAINKNTEAVVRVGGQINALAELIETSQMDRVNQKWAVDALIAAIRGEPEPK